MERDAEFEELLRDARAGDAEAWERIFDRLADEGDEGAKLLAMARRVLPAGDRLRNFVESRDLLQSALRSGWFRVEEFRGTTSGELFSWLRTIIRRKLSRVRKRKRPSPTANDVEAGPLEDRRRRRAEDSPLAAVVRAEVKRKVWRALEKLPPEQRAVMELRLEGHRAPEIARLLGIKHDAVRKRESRAGERLRELLADERS